MEQQELTVLLRSWQAGQGEALEALFPMVYDALRRQAMAAYAGNPAATLQPTALVHEAYLKLAGQKVPWENRTHFFAVAAVIMRRILVDAARARLAGKRGAGLIHVPLDEALAVASNEGVDLLALDAALDTLAEIDPRNARIVELRFFGGLSEEEIAAILECSVKTVQRGWALARAFLRKHMGAPVE